MWYDDDWDDLPDGDSFQGNLEPEIPAGEFCCYWDLECTDLECESGPAPDPDHEDLHDIGLERAVADDGG